MSWSNTLPFCRTAFELKLQKRYFHILNTSKTQLKYNVSLSPILPKLKLAASFFSAQTLKQAESRSFLSDLHCCWLSPQSGFPSALWRFWIWIKLFFQMLWFQQGIIPVIFCIICLTLFSWCSPAKTLTEPLSALWHFLFSIPAASIAHGEMLLSVRSSSE